MPKYNDALILRFLLAAGTLGGAFFVVASFYGLGVAAATLILSKAPPLPKKECVDRAQVMENTYDQLSCSPGATFRMEPINGVSVVGICSCPATTVDSLSSPRE